MRREAHLLVALLVVTAAASEIPESSASCSTSRTVTSWTSTSQTVFYTPGAPFTPDAVWPYAPYGGSTTYYLRGQFWSFGGGNPATALGNDSGVFVGYSQILANYILYVPTWMRSGYYGGMPTHLGGDDADWQFPDVDGCITEDGSDPGGPDADECMVVALADLVHDNGYFALLSTPPDPDGNFTFNSDTGFPQTINLAPVPRPFITGSSLAGYNRIDLSLRVDSDPTAFGQNGFYLQCHDSEILLGYKLYVWDAAYAAPLPQMIHFRVVDRLDPLFSGFPALAPWVPLTTEVTPIGEEVELQATCHFGAIYIAATLVFGGVEEGAERYELPFLSQNSTKIGCGSYGSPGPGRIPPTLRIGKSPGIPGHLTFSWEPSCSELAQDYGIYEGAIGTWYGHEALDCSDVSGDLTEEVLPSEGDRYYLVVPNATPIEGSYGKDSNEMQRPPGQTVCEDVLVYGLCAD